MTERAESGWVNHRGGDHLGNVYDTVDGKWILNEEATKDQQKRVAEHEKHRRDLCFALRSRPLTDEEMGEVANYDYHLLVQMGVSYNETEIRRQFSDMLLQQFKLKAAAAQGSNGSKSPA